MCWRGGRTCDITTGDGAATDETMREVQEFADLKQKFRYGTSTVCNPAVYNVVLEDARCGPPQDKSSELNGDDPGIPESISRQGTNEGKVFPIADTKAATPGNYSAVTAAGSSGE